MGVIKKKEKKLEDLEDDQMQWMCSIVSGPKYQENGKLLNFEFLSYSMRNLARLKENY